MMPEIFISISEEDAAGRWNFTVCLDGEKIASSRLNPNDLDAAKALFDAAAKKLPDEFGSQQKKISLLYDHFRSAALRAQPSKKPTENGQANDDQLRYPIAQYLSDIQPEEVQWLWPGRIPLGKLTLLIGDPGLGKTFCLLDILARTTGNFKWPDCDAHSLGGGAIFLSQEDDWADTLAPRFLSAAADPAKIVALKGVKSRDDAGEYERAIDLQRDLGVIEQTIDTMLPDCRAIGFDPLPSFLGTKVDSHVNADVRRVLSPLAEFAARRKVAVIGITHLRKGEGQAIYRAMGSLAFVAAARAAWAITRDKSDPEGKRRLFLPVKCNLASDQNGLAFSLSARHTSGPPCVEWHPEPVTVTADEAMAHEQRKHGPEPEAQGEAEQFLRDVLADGPQPTKEVEKEARDGYGIAHATLKRARKSLGVESFRETIPGPWLLRFPNKLNKEPIDVQYKQPEPLEPLGGNLKETSLFDPHEAQEIQGVQVVHDGGDEVDWDQSKEEEDDANRALAEAGEGDGDPRLDAFFSDNGHEGF